MKLEDQVCTLVQAKMLKALGVKQESLFYWKENELQTNLCDGSFKKLAERFMPIGNKYYSAFTAAELVQMNGNTGNIENSYDSEREGQFYSFSHTNENDKSVLIYFKTFAEACANKLIKSIEDGANTVEEINKRLSE